MLLISQIFLSKFCLMYTINFNNYNLFINDDMLITFLLLIEERNYLGSQFQRNGRMSVFCRHGGKRRRIRVHILNSKQKAEKTKTELDEQVRLLFSKSSHSHILFPARLHHINNPKQHQQLYSSIQVLSTSGGISHTIHNIPFLGNHNHVIKSKCKMN